MKRWENGEVKLNVKVRVDITHLPLLRGLDEGTRPTAISCVLSVQSMYSQTVLSNFTLKLYSQTVLSNCTL